MTVNEAVEIVIGVVGIVSVVMASMIGGVVIVVGVIAVAIAVVASGGGLPPHRMAISTETIDELTNESSGRGLLARRSVNKEDELPSIPLDLCVTKRSTRKALGKECLGEGINKYLAIACQLIHEQFFWGRGVSGGLIWTCCRWWAR